MCCRAFAAVYPSSIAMRFSEKCVWQDDEEYIDVKCPDGFVTYRLTRINETSTDPRSISVVEPLDINNVCLQYDKVKGSCILQKKKRTKKQLQEEIKKWLDKKNLEDLNNDGIKLLASTAQEIGIYSKKTSVNDIVVTLRKHINFLYNKSI